MRFVQQKCSEYFPQGSKAGDVKEFGDSALKVELKKIEVQEWWIVRRLVVKDGVRM